MAAILTTLGELSGELVLGVSVILILGLAATFVWRAPVLQQRLGEATLAATISFLLFACIPLPRPLAALTDAAGIPDTIVGSHPTSSPATSPQPTLESDASEAIVIDEPAKREPGVAAPLDSQSPRRPDARVVDAVLVGEDAREDLPTVRQNSGSATDEPASEFGNAQDERVTAIPALESPDAFQSDLIAAAPRDRQQSSATSWKRRVATFYVVFASAVFAWLVIGWLRLHRTLRRAHAPTGWLAREYEDLPWSPNRRRPRLLISSQAIRPFCYGFWRPCIVVPESDAQPSRQQRLRQILLHEMAHAARRDAFGLSLATIAMPVLYFHPAYWWLKSRVEFAAELLADDWAARHTSPTTYARELVAWVKERGTNRSGEPAGIGMFRSPSAFYRRMNLLLRRTVPLAQTCSLRVTFTSVASCIATAALLASAFGVPYSQAHTQTNSESPAAATDFQIASLPPPTSSENGSTNLDQSSNPTGKVLDLIDPGGTPALVRRFGSPELRVADREGPALVSPDGKILAVSSRRGIYLWNLDTYKLLRRLNTRSSTTVEAQFTKDSKSLLTGHWNGHLYVWDIDSGELRYELLRHAERIEKMALSADTQRAITVDRMGVVCLWDIASGKLLHAIEGPRGPPGLCRFSDNGEELEVWHGVSWYRWSATTGKPLPERASPVEHAEFLSPDGRYRFDADEKSHIVREVATGAEKLRIPVSGAVTWPPRGKPKWQIQKAMLPDGDRLAVVRGDTLEIYNLKTGVQTSEKVIPTGQTGIFSPDGSRVLMHGEGAQFKVWDVEKGTRVKFGDEFDASIGAMAFSPDGKYLATTGYEQRGRLQLWDVATMTEVDGFAQNVNRALTENAEPEVGPRIAQSTQSRFAMTPVQISADNKQLVAVDNSFAYILTVPDGKLVTKLQSKSSQTGQAAFLLDGRSIVVGGWGSEDVEVYDVATGTLAHRLPEHWASAPRVAAARGRNIAASASFDRTVVLWDTKTWERLHVLEGMQDSPRVVALSDDGSTVVAAAESSLNAWSCASGKSLWSRLLPSAWTRPTSLSPDGRYLAVVAIDQPESDAPIYSFLVLDATTGKDVAAVGPFDGYLTALSFTPDSQQIAAAVPDGTVWFWEVNKLVGQAAEKRP